MSDLGRPWDAIVIGSGLGGLAAGCAMARAGKRVLVLERLSNFGGAATVWRHGRLTMEASLHETDGGEVFSEHGTFRRLGVLKDLDPLATDLCYEVRGKALPGIIRMPHGLEAAREAVAPAFPESREGLDSYFRALSRLQQTLMEFEELGVRGPSGLMGMLFSGRLFELIADTRLTVAQGLQQFFGDHEPVKLALSPHMAYFDDEPSKLSFLGFAAITAQYIQEGSYYLRGGSRSLTMALLHAIKDAGGEARRQRTVSEIILDADGRAAGVLHAGPEGDIEEAYAPIVFGNAAPQHLAAMLPAQDQALFLKPYESYEPSISLFTVALGLDKPPASFGVSAYSTFIYPDWMTRLDQYAVSADVFGGEPGAALPLYGLCDYASLDPQLGPEGDLYPLSLTGVDRLWAWAGLSEAEDHARREAWISAFLEDLERRYPGLKGAVQHAEMATARTLKNRLGTPEGEAYGFKPTPKRLFGRALTPRTAIPGLWLASAYTLSGGYAGALHGGLLAAQAAQGDLQRRAGRARRADIVYG
jgi:phytoene dehydrogenase-like protein